MGPQLLIVADPRGGDVVAGQVRAIGYAVERCAPRELNRRVRLQAPPDAVMLSADDADASLLLAALRRSRRGASIPVLVYGSLGGAISDLADVLDLGGDGFVPTPIDPGVLAQALDELVGPPGSPSRPLARTSDASEGGDTRVPRLGSSTGTSDPEELHPAFTAPPAGETGFAPASHAASRAASGVHSAATPSWRAETTDVLDDAIDHMSRPAQRSRFAPELPAGAAPSSANPVLGQLHATLDRLEAKLRNEGETGEEPDDELASFGFDDIPDVEPEGAPIEHSDPNEDISLEAIAGLDPAIVRGVEDDQDPQDRKARELDRRRELANRREADSRVDRGHTSHRSERGEAASLDVRGAREPGAIGDHGAEQGVPSDEGGDSFTDLAVLRQEREAARSPDAYEGGADSRVPDRAPAPAASTRRRPGGSRASDAHERSAVLRPRRPDRSHVPDAGDHEELGDMRAGAGASANEKARAVSRRATHRPSAPPSLERGSLREIPLAALLWRLHNDRFSGRLSLRHQRFEREFWLVEGDLRFARSNVMSERLVDSLLRRGVLTRPQYETARRLAAKEPRRAGELLVEAGFIKPRELERVIRDHLARLVESAFGWDDASWESRSGEQVDEPVSLDLPMLRILLDGVRVGATPPQIRAWLGERLLRPTLRTDDARRAELIRRLEVQLALLPEEVAWLQQFRGQADVETLLGQDGDEQGLLALIYALHLSGQVDLLGTQKSEISARDPVQIDADRLAERLRLAREADYFELLGVGRDAARAEIRRAYGELDATFSDRQIEDETRVRLASQLAELRAALREARDILVDDAMRSAYLAHLDVDSTTSTAAKDSGSSSAFGG